MVAGALLRRSSGGSSAASFAKSWAQQWMMRRGASSAHHDGTLLFARPACSSSYSTSSQPPPPPLYTSTHEVLRPESVAPDGAVTMTVGLTERAFDMIGDVKRIETMVDTGAAVGAGEQLMKLHWEGFKRTASDELYHALWANVSDHRGLALPFAASVVGVNGAAMDDPYKTVTPGEAGWVVKVSASRAALEAAHNGGDLMDTERYRFMCEQQEEEEDAAASRSYP